MRITNFDDAKRRYHTQLSFRQRKLVDAYLSSRVPTPEGTPPHDEQRNFIEAVEIAVMTDEQDIAWEIALLQTKPKLREPGRSYASIYSSGETPARSR